MYEKFIDWRPKSHNRNLIKKASAVLTNNYVRSGYAMSPRQLYYILVTNEVIPHTHKSYVGFLIAIGQARMAGMIDWEHVEASPADITIYSSDGVSKKYAVEYWTNKKASSLTIANTAEATGAAAFVLSSAGFFDASILYRASQRVNKRAALGVGTRILFVGDSGPMTQKISEAALHRMQMMINRPVKYLEYRYIGITEEQGSQLKLQKSLDKKFYELESLHPIELAKLLQNQ